MEPTLSRATSAGIATPLSANARSRGLQYWMVTSFDVDNFFVPEDAPEFRYFVYQIEQCPDTGRQHVQGYLELTEQTRFNRVKEMFSPVVVHLEGRKARTYKPARDYCMKEATRVVGPYEIGVSPLKDAARAPPIDWALVRDKIQAASNWTDIMYTKDEELLRAVSHKLNVVREMFLAKPVAPREPQITLCKWEKEVLEILLKPPKERLIIWIWSEATGTGKTTFFKYCSSKFKVLPATLWTDMLHMFQPGYHDIIWYDKTRAQYSGDPQFYTDIELLSNHSIHSSKKYNGVVKEVIVHVVVTSNATPDEFRLPGRFLVVEAKKKEVEDAEEEAIVREFDAQMEDSYLRDLGLGNVPDSYNEELESVDEMQVETAEDITGPPEGVYWDEDAENLSPEWRKPPKETDKPEEDMEYLSDDEEEEDIGDEEPKDGESLGDEDTWSEDIQ